MTKHVLVQNLGLTTTHSTHYPQWRVNEGAAHFNITVDGVAIRAEEGDSILVAASKGGITIPAMCSDARIKPTGDCGLCVVELDGNAEPVKACETKVREGMMVVTNSEALTAIRRPILNNYLTNHNAYCLPPCSYRCPANIDIPGYLGLIAQKKYAEATALIKEKLPLPQIIGRVCPRPCESVCRRRQIDEDQPVAICSLKRFAADWAREQGSVTQPKPKAATGKKVAVVGAGPAGLTTAYYLALEGHQVTMLEAQEAAGGMLRYGIPPYRLPNQVLDDEVNDILSLGVELKVNQRLGRDYMFDTLTDNYDATFLAIGACVGKMARIPNETVPGVMAAVDFLAKVNRGEKVDLGQNVVVIGGGFTAADAVRTARRMGAPNVTLSYRRSRKEMPASPHEIHDCEVEGVVLDLLSAPVEVKVNEEGRAIGLVCQRMQLGEPDASGRRSPQPVPGSDYLIPADTVLLAISQDVDVKSMQITDIGTTKWGSIDIDEATMKTNLPGIFAGGDASLGAATAVEAIGQGRRAAYAIDAFLRGADDRAIAKVIEVERPKFFDIGAWPKQHAHLAEMPVLPQEERVSVFGTDVAPGDTGALSATGAFLEVELGFTEEQAIIEAERCLQCVCQAAGTCDLQKYSLEYGASTKEYKGPLAFAGNGAKAGKAIAAAGGGGTESKECCGGGSNCGGETKAVSDSGKAKECCGGAKGCSGEAKSDAGFGTVTSCGDQAIATAPYDDASVMADNYIQEHRAPQSLREPVVRGDDAFEGFYTPLQSLPFFEMNKEKCIQCLDCVRICNEVQHRSVYTVDDLGYPALVSGTYDYRDTECNNCGQCVSACPTGALRSLSDWGKMLDSKREKVTTTCSYCGVGCALNLEVENNRVVAVSGAFVSDANEGNLCVKGRYGMEFIHSKDRLTVPLIRRGGKDSPLEEASWDEAIRFAADNLKAAKDKYGPAAIGTFASARATNEDNYVFQRFARTALGTNNIDHCARLCHMASAVGLAMSVGSSAPSASTPDIRMADAFIVAGSNTTETHPVISSAVMKAKYEDGAKIVVIDPRRIEMVNHADVWLRPRLGTNVAVINGLAHVILEEGMIDAAFIQARTEDFEAFRASVKKYTPEYVEQISGVPAERLREAARIYGKAQRGMLLWGMGVTQHLTGVDACLALSNLFLMTGHVGKPGAGFIPIRGQNNVQGCSDMQGQHNALPGYHDINNPEHRAKFEKAWGNPLPTNPYMTVVEMEEAALHGDIKAMYIMGENPMGSSPDVTEVEQGLRNLEFLVVQDMFLSQTAELADVVFPVCSFAEKDGTYTNTERRVQLIQKAIPPVGESRPDWQVVCDVSAAMGYPMPYTSSAQVMEEIASLVPSYGGIRHERLHNGGLQWPCYDETHPGTRYLYAENFPTANGLGKFHAIEFDDSGENADDAFPLVLSTGRLLEHYHTGTMTRRNRGINVMKPEGEVEVHPEDARRFNVAHGEMVRLVSHHGAIEVKVKVTERSPEGLIFYPFHYAEASANRLTGTSLDKQSKTPAYKRSAARIEKIV